MKKYNIFKISSYLFGIFFLLAASLFLSTITAVAGITSAVGAVIADTAVTVQNTKANSTLDRNYISRKVTEMRPSATPLDTVMRSITNGKDINAFVSEYYAVDSRPVADSVKTLYTKPTDGATTVDLAVNNISAWSADDTVKVNTILGSDSKELVCFVISKNVTNGTIKIQPLNGPLGTGANSASQIVPTIASGITLTRMGSCKHELDAQTSPYAMLPVKDFNYMQIFMAQVEESTFQKIHDQEADWDFSDYEAQNIYDMRQTMEFSSLFGVRAKFVDLVNAKERYATGGITRFITKNLQYGTGGSDRTIDDSTFVDWTKAIFTGNSGSESRIFFGGDALTANISKISTVQKQIEAKKTEVKWGVKWNQIETNFGILLYKHHSLLDYAGWGEKGIVVDPNHIEKHTFKPMATRKLDLKASGQRNVDAVVLEETTGLITRYPDTHAIIGPKA
jgi:hypothetical protein